MPRPRQHFPPGARTLLLAQAESGALSETKACAVLGIGWKTFRRLLRDNEECREIWEEAQAAERDQIRAKLCEKAREGDANCLRLYLAAFHNVREQASTDDNKSNVVINLPSALSEAQYKRLFEHEPTAIEDGS